MSTISSEKERRIKNLEHEAARYREMLEKQIQQKAYLINEANAIYEEYGVETPVDGIKVSPILVVTRPSGLTNVIKNPSDEQIERYKLEWHSSVIETIYIDVSSEPRELPKLPS